MIDFVGLKPIRLGDPEIELETLDGEVVDLYNCHYLLGARLDGSGLTFEFCDWKDASRLVVVHFADVRDLAVTQPSDWVRGESDQIEDLLIRPEGPWKRLVFRAGGLEYEFNCGAIHLDVAQHPADLVGELASLLRRLVLLRSGRVGS